MDEFIDELLRNDRVCDIMLPVLQVNILYYTILYYTIHQFIPLLYHTMLYPSRGLQWSDWI